VPSLIETLLFLKQTTLFHTMTFGQLQALVPHFETRHIQAGEVIFAEGTHGQQLYLIVSGQVRIVAGFGRPRGHTLALLKARDFFGDRGIFERTRHQATAIAATDAELLLLSADAFLQAIAQHPEMVLDVARELSIRLRRAEERHLHEAAGRPGLPRHILVPVDFGPSASQALAYASALATTLEARLTVLHVIEPLGLWGWEGTLEVEASLAAYFTQLEATTRRKLVDMTKHVRDAGVTCAEIVATGIPFQVIIETASARQAELIIMGSHGRTGFAHMLLGSVAERVVQLGSCPVLVVRGQEGHDTEVTEPA
jgi:nucleotide-binding universal stress UspA family protein